jgi:hypothetical protein
VGRSAGFKLAVIGFEVSGFVRAERIGDELPDERAYGLLLSADAGYLPATM